MNHEDFSMIFGATLRPRLEILSLMNKSRSFLIEHLLYPSIEIAILVLLYYAIGASERVSAVRLYGRHNP